MVDKVLENLITGDIDKARDIRPITDLEREEVTKAGHISAHESGGVHDLSSEGTLRGNDPIHPLDAMLDAWNATLSDYVIGSSTICVATIDTTLNQLSYANLGDGGLMVVRKMIASGTAGYVEGLEEGSDSDDRSSKYSLAYLSQQQLRSFNLPYQLGYSGNVGYGGSFENPIDSDTGISVLVLLI